mmetsp:Transcript_12171/g.15782  ORF Transcript_12171/g.15782 Transcript_12171/m.15782 type:complete len:570 (-) Transcript_12171:801-2510(-)
MSTSDKKPTLSWAGIAAASTKDHSKLSQSLGKHGNRSESKGSAGKKVKAKGQNKSNNKVDRKKPRASASTSLFDFIQKPKRKGGTGRPKAPQQPKRSTHEKKTPKVETDKSKEVGLRRKGDKKKQLSTLKKRVLKERKWRQYLEYPECAPFLLKVHPSWFGLEDITDTPNEGTGSTGKASEEGFCSFNSNNTHPAFFGKEHRPMKKRLEENGKDEPPILNDSNTNCLQLEDGQQDVKSPEKIRKIQNVHSVREYVRQALDPNLDFLVSRIVKTLFELQRRQYVKDPIKAKARRRLVLGMREVQRGLRSGNLKCVIVAYNIDQGNESVHGGIDDNVSAIIENCCPTLEEKTMGKKETTLIFALNKSKLGEAVGKRIKISTVGIQSLDGAYEDYKEAVKILARAKAVWTDLVERERKSGSWFRCELCGFIIEHTYQYCTDCEKKWCTRCFRSTVDKGEKCEKKLQIKTDSGKRENVKKKPGKKNTSESEDMTCKTTAVRIARIVPKSIFTGSEPAAEKATSQERRSAIRDRMNKTGDTRNKESKAGQTPAPKDTKHILNANAREFIPVSTR